jgi:hypothetical protein
LLVQAVGDQHHDGASSKQENAGQAHQERIVWSDDDVLTLWHTEGGEGTSGD